MGYNSMKGEFGTERVCCLSLANGWGLGCQFLAGCSRGLEFSECQLPIEGWDVWGRWIRVWRLGNRETQCLETDGVIADLK